MSVVNTEGVKISSDDVEVKEGLIAFIFRYVGISFVFARNGRAQGDRTEVDRKRNSGTTWAHIIWC